MSVSQRLGQLQHHHTIHNGISGNTPSGCFRVIVYSHSIFRVSISRGPDYEDFSYSVAASPLPEAPVIIDELNQIIVRTTHAQLVIQKHPVSFSLQDLAGTILNEDDTALGTSWIGDQVTTYKKMQEGERFIGLGEKTGPLDRKGAGYQNWNTDAYAYNANTDPLYCSMPFYIGLHHEVQYGIFLDNSHKSFFNFGASNNRFSSFAADAGDMNYYLIHGESVPDILENYTWLTGRIPMPPKWSIGYQQARYSYYPDKEVLNAAHTFREKKIPADAIVLDIHYMDKYKIFTWDQQNFPDPKSLIDQLKRQGFEVVLMCDPGIKAEAGYEAYEDGKKHDVFVKYPDGEYYTGQVWPGWCHFPDFTNPVTRRWWGRQLKSYSDIGVEGYWNDMNEIATWGNMLPENLEFDFDGNKTTSRKARNLYGFQMSRSTYESTRELLKGKRPFNLTRSGFAGIQRYATVWTGDNVAYDEHMLLGIRLVNSLGLTGVAFAGYDIGGFVGDANKQLFARWIAIGSLSPFFRGHSMINSKDSEPWSFGEEVEQISRNYIRLRYQLLPYIYSLFYEASKTGMPVQRSLAIDYSHDARVFSGQYQHQYLFGPSILVAPVESNKEFVKVFFPSGGWYSIFDGTFYEGNQEVIVECPMHRLPVFVKAGAILPMQRPVQHTKEQVDELILHVYAGKDDAQFQFYEDDGATYQYEAGSFSCRQVTYSPVNRTIEIKEQEGNYISGLKSLKLILHRVEAQSLRINGVDISVAQQRQSFFQPLEKYDPINDPDSMGEEDVLVCQVPLSSNHLSITW